MESKSTTQCIILLMYLASLVNSAKGLTMQTDMQPMHHALTYPGSMQCRHMWQAPRDSAMDVLMGLAGLRPQLTTSHTQLLQQLHTKLAINCCINPLTALLGCSNGYLIAQQHTRCVGIGRELGINGWGMRGPGLRGLVSGTITLHCIGRSRVYWAGKEAGCTQHGLGAY